MSSTGIDRISLAVMATARPGCDYAGSGTVSWQRNRANRPWCGAKSPAARRVTAGGEAARLAERRPAVATGWLAS